MANLRDIKKRISSVTTTKQITRTMEMVSTAKIRRALDRSKQAEPYKEALTDVMLTVAGDASCSGTDPMLHKHETVKHGLIVVIASDRGLAGGFNTTVERTAEKLAASWANDGVECEIIACGSKPATYFRDRANVIMHFEGNSSEPDFNQARMISSHICDAYRAGELDRVELVYHHAKNRVDQELRVEHLLPLDPEMIAMAHGCKLRHYTCTACRLSGNCNLIWITSEISNISDNPLKTCLLIKASEIGRCFWLLFCQLRM